MGVSKKVLNLMDTERLYRYELNDRLIKLFAYFNFKGCLEKLGFSFEIR
jgi:hypothetical protein